MEEGGGVVLVRVEGEDHYGRVRDREFYCVGDDATVFWSFSGIYFLFLFFVFCFLFFVFCFLFFDFCFLFLFLFR